MGAKEKGLKGDPGVNIMVRKSPSEKFTFQLKPKRREGAHDAKSSGKRPLGGENNMCKYLRRKTAWHVGGNEGRTEGQDPVSKTWSWRKSAGEPGTRAHRNLNFNLKTLSGFTSGNNMIKCIFLKAHAGGCMENGLQGLDKRNGKHERYLRFSRQG